MRQVLNSVYDQLAAILAKASTGDVLDLKANDEMQSRFDELASKSKEHTLTEDEKDELDHFLVLERLVRPAEIRASHSDS
jgi:hypothetical protein